MQQFHVIVTSRYHFSLHHMLMEAKLKTDITGQGCTFNWKKQKRGILENILNS